MSFTHGFAEIVGHTHTTTTTSRTTRDADSRIRLHSFGVASEKVAQTREWIESRRIGDAEAGGEDNVNGAY